MERATPSNYQHRPTTFNVQNSIHIDGSNNFVKWYGNMASFGGVEYSLYMLINKKKNAQNYQHRPKTFNKQNSIFIGGSNILVNY